MHNTLLFILGSGSVGIFVSCLQDAIKHAAHGEVSKADIWGCGSVLFWQWQS